MTNITADRHHLVCPLQWIGFVALNNVVFSLAACLQIDFGIQAIFGPTDPLLGSHIQSICEALDIPHVEARLDFDTSPKEFSINLHPAQKFMNNAYKDLIIYLNWTKVAIIYEDDFGKSHLFVIFPPIYPPRGARPTTCLTAY